MLTCLTISNYALIEHAEIEFHGGFTVFTGESGAGKSIVMSAIRLLTGGRVERGAIRTGCDRCTISAEFTVPENLHQEIASLLDASGIALEETSLTLRRVITANATRNFINDVPVGAKMLAELGTLLIDIHSAGEQAALTQPAKQLDLLDLYGSLSGMRGKCAALCRELDDLAAEQAEFEQNLPDVAEADRLALVAEEIDRIHPAPDEDKELSDRQKLGANARQVLETISGLTDLLTESENSVADRLGTAYHELTELARINDSLVAGLPESCAELQDNLANLSAKIADLAEKVELDPEALSAIEARLGEIYTLKRRYGPTLEQVLETREKAQLRLDEFKASKERRDSFALRRRELQHALQEISRKLSAARKGAAKELLGRVTAKLDAIGFHQARLEAEFTEVPSSASGMDKLELLFSANPGEDLRPLRKIASSGELSRLMLALKTVLADADSVPTVIFDEIDMNIGGETANRVAEELHHLGANRQILCISHLAQVAARADEHFKVSKQTTKGRTVSHAERLADPTEELARMLGGGDSALRHAAEMRKSLKKTL